MRTLGRIVAGLLCLASVPASAQIIGPGQPYQDSSVAFAGHTSYYDANAVAYTASTAGCGCATEADCGVADCGCPSDVGCGAAACSDGCSSCGGGICGGCNGCGCNGGCCCNSGCNWCNLGDAISVWGLLHPRCEPAISIGGWLSGGYHDNNTPLSNTPGDGLAFNDLPDRMNLHQAWVYAEKVADTGGYGFDWGFRGDAMYGTDASKTQAFGNPPGSWDFQNGLDHGDYGWAFPQLYGEVAVNDLSFKIGHFFTLVGYEVVPATGNFFYSHALTMFNSEPFTHTGAIGTYSAFEDLTFYGGWTAGWDTGFDSLNSGSNFLGGASLSPGENVTVTYICTAGNFGARGGRGYSHSFVADLTVTEKVNYVFQSDMVRVDSVGDDAVSVNQYLFYSLNDCVKLGGRLEWWKNQGISYYEATAGINIRPHANFVVRPEIRFDWTPTTVNPNVLYPGGDRTTFGIDGILTY